MNDVFEVVPLYMLLVFHKKLQTIVLLTASTKDQIPMFRFELSIFRPSLSNAFESVSTIFSRIRTCKEEKSYTLVIAQQITNDKWLHVRYSDLRF